MTPVVPRCPHLSPSPLSSSVDTGCVSRTGGLSPYEPHADTQLPGSHGHAPWQACQRRARTGAACELTGCPPLCRFSTEEDSPPVFASSLPSGRFAPVGPSSSALNPSLTHSRSSPDPEVVHAAVQAGPPQPLGPGCSPTTARTRALSLLHLSLDSRVFL